MYFKMNLFTKILGILKSFIFNHIRFPTLDSMCFHNLLAYFSWLTYAFSKSLMAHAFLS
jgi:hypothetical protein